MAREEAQNKTKGGIDYIPYNERTPDFQYQELLKKIKTTGKDKVPIHVRLSENAASGHQNSKEITGAMLQFKMSNGFPVLTERDLSKSFYGAIGELVAFLNGQSTLGGLKEYGCPEVFWKDWVTKEKCAIFGLPEGDLGEGSYGASLGHFRSAKGEFDQVSAVQRQMEKAPFLRTHVLTTWNPPLSMGDEAQGFKRQVVVAPCHGNFIHFVLFDEQKELEMTHTQRSADVPVGLQLNLIEWSALGLMVAHLLGYKFTKYTHFLSNPHYYDIQAESVDKILSIKPKPFPTVTLRTDRDVTRLQDFRKEDFLLDDYEPEAWFKIPTPI
ncbi:MAG: thymidylate synthase [Candidatus Pacebacteria bacterium]|nr:thymidylate synthase [Candidatus Paceibacterota bacterium]